MHLWFPSARNPCDLPLKEGGHGQQGQYSVTFGKVRYRLCVALPHSHCYHPMELLTLVQGR
jgi:hypothetical protein